MESKTPYIFVLIGVILGFLGSMSGFGQYFIFKSVNQGQGGFFSEFFSGFFNQVGVNFGNILIWILISSIVGLILSIILIFYAIKFSKGPTEMDCIITTILGGLGIFLGMGLGGILVLIGGIMGIVRSNKS